MNYQPSRHNKKALGRIARKLAACSDTNRPTMEAVTHRLQDLNRSPKTTLAYCILLGRLDAFAPERAWADLDGPTVQRFLASIRSPRPRTNRSNACSLKAALNHVWLLATGAGLPADHAISRAIVLPKVPKAKPHHVLTDADIEGLCAAAGTPPRQFLHIGWTELVQALLRLLRASGFRVSEALSLNVGDVELDGPDACWLTLREEAPLLGDGDHKTGPRRIYIAEGVASLRAWLELHPLGTTPSAPLFPSFSGPRNSKRDGQHRMTYDSVLNVLARLDLLAGLTPSKPSDFKLKPHLFRHTCATAKARLGWNEPQLRAYFGWSADSKEPSLYVHLVAADMRDRVRRDHGLDAAGHAAAATVVDPAMAAAVAKYLTEHGFRPLP